MTPQPDQSTSEARHDALLRVWDHEWRQMHRAKSGSPEWLGARARLLRAIRNTKDFARGQRRRPTASDEERS